MDNIRNMYSSGVNFVKSHLEKIEIPFEKPIETVCWNCTNYDPGAHHMPGDCEFGALGNDDPYCDIDRSITVNNYTICPISSFDAKPDIEPKDMNLLDILKKLRPLRS